MIGLYGGIFQRCQNVILFQKRIVLQNFLMGRSRAEQAEKVSDADTLPPDAGMSTAFTGLNGDSGK